VGVPRHKADTSRGVVLFRNFGGDSSIFDGENDVELVHRHLGVFDCLVEV